MSKIEEFKGSKDYVCIAFYSDRSPIRWGFVTDVWTDIRKLYAFGKLSHVNVYARRSARFIVQYRPDTPENRSLNSSSFVLTISNRPQ